MKKLFAVLAISLSVSSVAMADYDDDDDYMRGMDKASCKKMMKMDQASMSANDMKKMDVCKKMMKM
ncbi:MAG: hypothetical protein QM529_05310 [Hydrotalea sp.]|nr:hypothetical protein [Hydrotalea sp.]